MSTKKPLLAQLTVLRIQGAKVLNNCYQTHTNTKTKATFLICWVKKNIRCRCLRSRQAADPQRRCRFSSSLTLPTILRSLTPYLITAGAYSCCSEEALVKTKCSRMPCLSATEANRDKLNLKDSQELETPDCKI